MGEVYLLGYACWRVQLLLFVEEGDAQEKANKS